MSIDPLLRMLDRDEQARFNATGTIHRITGETLSTASGTYTQSTSSVYSGSMLVIPETADERTVDYGGQDVNVRRYLVKVPRNTDVHVDDIVTVTDGGGDDDLDSETLTVVDVEHSAQQTARRLVCLHNRGG